MLRILDSLRAMAVEDAERFRKTTTRNVALYAVAAVMALTAYACLVVAALLWAMRQGDPVIAAAVVAVAFLVLALLLLAVVAMLNRAERQRRAERKEIYASAVRSAVRSTAESALIGAVLKPQTLAAGAAVLIAGLALGVLDGKGRGTKRTTPPPDRG